MAKKKKNPNDTTFRITNGLKKKIIALTARVKRLELILKRPR